MRCKAKILLGLRLDFVAAFDIELFDDLDARLRRAKVFELVLTEPLTKTFDEAVELVGNSNTLLGEKMTSKAITRKSPVSNDLVPTRSGRRPPRSLKVSRLNTLIEIGHKRAIEEMFY
jgi:hypothetical protein